MYPVRTAAKAAIIQEEKLLLIKSKGVGKTYYSLPGGGQQEFETLPETLVRECREELGVTIIPGELLHIREYMRKPKDLQDGLPLAPRHQVDFIFRCTLKEPMPTGNTGEQPDSLQVGAVWVPLAELSKGNIYPSVLQEIFTNPEKFSVYLGRVD